MSSQSMRAEQARLETCHKCKRWHGFEFDAEGEFGRCGKFTQRYVMTRAYDTCENFKAKNEVKA